MSLPCKGSMNTSCAACWMDFDDEAGLIRHIETEHQSASVVPPYKITDRGFAPNAPTGMMRRRGDQELARSHDRERCA